MSKYSIFRSSCNLQLSLDFEPVFSDDDDDYDDYSFDSYFHSV